MGNAVATAVCAKPHSCMQSCISRVELGSSEQNALPAASLLNELVHEAVIFHIMFCTAVIVTSCVGIVRDIGQSSENAA